MGYSDCFIDPNNTALQLLWPIQLQEINFNLGCQEIIRKEDENSNLFTLGCLN